MTPTEPPKTTKTGQEGNLFIHKHLNAKESYCHKDIVFEIAIYRAQENGHYSGYISAGGFSDLIGEISDTIASDIRTTTRTDPVDVLLQTIKSEIDAGKFEVAAAGSPESAGA